METFLSTHTEQKNSPVDNANFCGLSITLKAFLTYSAQILINVNENENTTKQPLIYIRQKYNDAWGGWFVIRSETI